MSFILDLQLFSNIIMNEKHSKSENFRAATNYETFLYTINATISIKYICAMTNSFCIALEKAKIWFQSWNTLGLLPQGEPRYLAGSQTLKKHNALDSQCTLSQLHVEYLNHRSINAKSLSWSLCERVNRQGDLKNIGYTWSLNISHAEKIEETSLCIKLAIIKNSLLNVTGVINRHPILEYQYAINFPKFPSNVKNILAEWRLMSLFFA